MDSHITVPRSVFKEFADDKNFFFKYEVEKGVISKGFPRKTYTKENYYSKAMEEVLNKNIETPLKKLLDYARQLPNQDTYMLDENLIEIAKTYFKSLVAHSPLLCQSMVENSVYMQFLSSQEQHDMAVDYAMFEPKMAGLEKNYDYTFMINLTDVPFLF